MKHYPRELKLEAVRMFFEEGMTQAEITQTLEIRSEGRVETWVTKNPRRVPGLFFQKLVPCQALNSNPKMGM